MNTSYIIGCNNICVNGNKMLKRVVIYWLNYNIMLTIVTILISGHVSIYKLVNDISKL